MSDNIPDTSSIFGDMLGGFGFGGFGSLFKLASDPRMQAQVMQVAQSLIESAQANMRIEAKLDILLRENGHDVDGINRRIADDFGQRAAAVLDGRSGDGVDGLAAARVVADVRNSGAAPAHRATRKSARGR